MYTYRRYRIDRTWESVKEVQEYLRALDIYYGTVPALGVDGIYGEETRAAVRKFQERSGLPVTGRTDAVTWELLYAEYAALRQGALFPLQAAFPLRLGDSGREVRLLQLLLLELSEREVPLDGYFGTTTAEAVRRMEERYGLLPTGVVEETLWRLILEDYRGDATGIPALDDSDLE